jgi:hypothetical protein
MRLVLFSITSQHLQSLAKLDKYQDFQKYMQDSTDLPLCYMAEELIEMLEFESSHGFAMTG